MIARTSPTASPPRGAPRRDHRARRRPRRGARRLRPVRRRLHRRARQRVAVAEPRLLGGAAGLRRRADRHRLAGPLRPELGGAQGARSRSCARPRSPTARSTCPRTTPAASPSSSETISNAAAEPGAPLPPPEGLHRRPARTTCAPGSTPASPSPTSFAPLEAFRPERDRRDGIEHLVVFPMYKQNASRDTCFEALIVRVPWPAFVAELERSGYDNPKFVPVNFVDYTAGYDSECAVLFPETFSTAERPPEPLRRHLLRPRGGALPPRLRPRRRAPAAQPAARRRLPSDLARALRGRLHRLGPDPRPHAHARRPALRPVHDPPAQPLLDVLARGASLRPDGVRRGGEARARRLRLRPLRAVRDPLRPPVPLPRHRQPGPQLRRPRRPAPVRLPPRRGLPALDRQPPDDRLGAGRRGRRRPARARPGPLPLRASTARSSGSGSPPTTWSPPTCRPPTARAGRRSGATCPRSTSRRSSSTWSRTTSSRSASSTSQLKQKLEPVLARPEDAL